MTNRIKALEAAHYLAFDDLRRAVISIEHPDDIVVSLYNSGGPPISRGIKVQTRFETTQGDEAYAGMSYQERFSKWYHSGHEMEVCLALTYDAMREECEEFLRSFDV